MRFLFLPLNERAESLRSGDQSLIADLRDPGNAVLPFVDAA